MPPSRGLAYTSFLQLLDYYSSTIAGHSGSIIRVFANIFTSPMRLI